MRISPGLESPVCQCRSQPFGNTCQFHAIRVKIRHPVKDKTSPCHVYRRQCSGENQTALRVHQEIPKHLVTNHESPVRCKCLPESTHDKINIVNTALLLATSQPVRTSNPNSVRLIHVQERIVFPFQIAQFLQVCHIAIHAEDRLRHDKHVLVLLPVIKQDFP